MRRLKVGVIGLGEVAQIIHLPILESLKERFEIAALCDVSQQLLQYMGEKYRVNQLYTDALALTRQPDLDVVFVLSSDEYHAECAIAAAKNKKHVLIEKPMTLTFAEADAIIKARDEGGVQVMVGYMRRFAPAFTQAVEEIKSLGKINYAKIRDFIGHNRLFIQQSSVVQRFQDIPEEAKADRRSRGNQLVTEAIGEASPEIRYAYGQLTSLNSHDLSAMRELIGMPNRVVSAACWKGGNFISAIFEFDGYYATFETGADYLRRFDGHLEVNGDYKSLLVQYNTPYIRHLPTMLTIRETVNEEFRETVIRPTFKDAYTVELEYFYDAITQGFTPKTTPEDYKNDLVLFKMIIEQLKKQS